MPRTSFAVSASSLLLSLLLSAGCWHLARPSYVGQTTKDLVQIPYPPPPARVEFVPDEPSPDSVWIDGEWQWAGRAWAWKRGRWVVPPAKASFSPWTTVRGQDGMLYFAPGVWRGVDGQAITAPSAISYGKPTAGAIVDSEGVTEHTGKSIKENETKEEKQADRAEKKQKKAEDADAGITKATKGE